MSRRVYGIVRREPAQVQRTEHSFGVSHRVYGARVRGRAQVPRTDLIFFCSPNNPTGAAATRKQLEELVAFARRNGSIIVYDAAYALYISDPDCPRTIFEIPGGACLPVDSSPTSLFCRVWEGCP
jgi:histidinol-phosphate/aromatic aminotransferase/cobyric acid decarboxylase-like protein